jgi:hypothetical protein
MEIWFDPVTKELKAVYSTPYTGTVWQAQGYVSMTLPGRQVPSAFQPGAILDITGTPRVITPAPLPTPSMSQIRVGELQQKLSDDTITDAEIRELLRLERGL